MTLRSDEIPVSYPMSGIVTLKINSYMFFLPLSFYRNIDSVVSPFRVDFGGIPYSERLSIPVGLFLNPKL